MNWVNQLSLERFNLLPPVPSSLVENAEEQLGVRFPDAYREFLMHADGGMLGNFIFYSVGAGLHPDETILQSNLQRSHDFPLLSIGRDASDDFGFERGAVDQLDRPVF